MAAAKVDWPRSRYVCDVPPAIVRVVLRRFFLVGGFTPLTEQRGRTLFLKDFPVTKFGGDLDGTGGFL
eukprot:CAMPEP_0194272036 /NCGR_PEP_ID=MMETSP0169-20130528/5696_1 /TAXON_ID=218684 /ORGANISM="Corethron pennatum, Strain L29A3" /LENGTH=67 /DNA_ID=CAMNT_0039014583 /DNA_START=697 /DNA_END=900 /DNA_ORIENTATION=+